MAYEIIYAPVWWYSAGAVGALNRFFDRLRFGNQYFGWSVWLVNIFRPMYAQRDFAGRAISFVVRIIQVIVRSMLLLGWSMVALLMLLSYFFLPVIVILEIFYQWPLS